MMHMILMTADEYDILSVWLPKTEFLYNNSYQDDTQPSFKKLFFKAVLIQSEDTNRECLNRLRQSLDKKLRHAGIEFKLFYADMAKLFYIMNLDFTLNLHCDYIFRSMAFSSALPIHCGISEGNNDHDIMHKLFTQANAALKESIFKGLRICKFHEISQNNKEIVGISDQMMLLDLFIRGQKEEVFKLLNDILARISHSMCNAVETVQILINLVSYLHVNLSGIYWKICDMEEVGRRIANAKNLYSMTVVMHETIEQMFTNCLESNEKHYSNYIVNYLINEVRARYNEKISLYRLANSLSMNYNYISGLFSKKTGVTFQEYLLSYRLDKARELLLNGECCLNDIAGKCGFYDSKHMGKAFKKRFNKAPGEYRSPGVR